MAARGPILLDESPAPPPPDAPRPTDSLFNAISIGVAVLSPIAMLLPPRKMDLRFFALSAAFSISTNQLAYNYTGQSLYSRFGSRVASAFDTSPPAGVQLARDRLREEKAARLAHEAWQQQQQQQQQQGQLPPQSPAPRQQQEQQERKNAEQTKANGDDNKTRESKGLADLVKKTWMGDETEGWQQRRAAEERAALEEGKGVGELIADHIRDAFGYRSVDDHKEESSAGSNGKAGGPKKG